MIEIDESPATEETKKDGSDDGFEEFSDFHKDTQPHHFKKQFAIKHPKAKNFATA